MFAQRLRRIVLSGALAVAAAHGSVTVVVPPDASPIERLAAREARRYLYAVSGRLAPLSATLPRRGDAIVVSRADRRLVRNLTFPARMGAQAYVLHTVQRGGRRVLVVCGGDGPGTLYGAYRFAERLGVRFSLHGDIIPDARLPFAVPRVNERGSPLFPLRGIQPFHDFPEGPDWWNADEYRAVVGQLPKLGMNFIGLHTYPENGPSAEPAVWIGPPTDVLPGGRVASAYPAAWQNTLLGTWGYAPRPTSGFHGGAAMLFDRDDFGADVMRGLAPRPSTPDRQRALFDRAGVLLKQAFTAAHALGVRTCVGTETPLTVPADVRARVRAKGQDPADLPPTLYEGIFRRIAKAYPLDYYWLWTPEGWTWSGTSQEQVNATLRDIGTAYSALKRSGAPFGLATCGWVLGPESDRALLGKALARDVTVSAINRQVGNTPVDPAFRLVSGRGKWAIPWLEDDPGLTMPQLWAARMQGDAADARDYGCTGLMGIHWRTRVLSPNIQALARAAWTQPFHVKRAPAPPEQDGQVSAFPEAQIANTADAPLYRTVRYNMTAFRVSVPNGLYTVTLRFVEPYYDAPGKRVFDVTIQGHPVIEAMDVFARVGKDRALDLSFPDVRVADGVLTIGFPKRVEFPCLAAFEVAGRGFTRKVNCGGPAYRDFQADAPPAGRALPAGAFYRDWAGAEFGPQAGAPAAALFTALDGRLPRPAGWTDGPGGLTPDARPWSSVSAEYAFVDRFAALGRLVHGAGERERFGYWNSQFQYLRAIHRVRCAWAAADAALASARAAGEPAARARIARETALPARRELARAIDEAYTHLMATVSTTGELGTIANWEQHILPAILDASGRELEEMLGGPLPEDAGPRRTYTGPVRIIVPAVRTAAPPREALRLRALVLSPAPVARVEIGWRPMGRGNYHLARLRHIARGVYEAALPPMGSDIEYYLRAVPAAGPPAYWPATAPSRAQTVVLGPSPSWDLAR